VRPRELEVGDRVSDSPVGPGEITGFTERGYPQVNRVAVARLRLEDGTPWDPHGSYSPAPEVVS
jgi:hypothetical protein